MQNQIRILANEPDIHIERGIRGPLPFSHSLVRKCHPQTYFKLISTGNSILFKPNFKIKRRSPLLFRLNIRAWIRSIKKPQKVF